VRAGIHKGADARFVFTDDEHGVVGNIVDHIITLARDLFEATGPLPRFSPDLFDLFVVEVVRGVTVKTDRLVTEKLEFLFEEWCRHRIAIFEQLVFGRGAGTSGLSR